ncbi:MAG: IS1634 family transposase [Lentisphaerae bacterium]|nr:IS1634 family transposase [Lentisphaerota bacterium]
MGTIINKPVKEYHYYYYVESARINGKPKYVNQVYLGTAERVREMAVAYKTPLQEKALYHIEKSFGAECLIYDIALRQGIVQIIDDLVPKRKQGASVGMYCLIEAINRALSPTSTTGIQKWYANTFLPVLTGIRTKLFNPQNFWNNTQCLTEVKIKEIEDAILSRMMETYDIDTSHLIYDATNFFTYIDTLTDSELAQRGHDKAKRNDLRTVGLALVIAPEYSIPLFYDVYPGNRAESKEFTAMIKKLKDHYEILTGKTAEITITFDRGNNSESNIGLLESGDIKLHYVGGLKKNQLPELFAIPKSDYELLTADNLAGCTAYRMNATVFKRELVTVIVYNPELEEGQLQGIMNNREKTTAKLMKIQEALLRRASNVVKKGKKPTVESVTKSVKRCLKSEYMEDLYTYKVLEQNGNVFLSFAFNKEALEEIRETQLGKTALFSDRLDYSNDEIVNAYRSAWHVESAFKQMKDTEHLAVRPFWHWTDEQIRIHVFVCVLAYRLCCLIVKELREQGIKTNVNELLEEMSRLKMSETFFGNIERPEKVRTFTLIDGLAQKVEEVYQLKARYGVR